MVGTNNGATKPLFASRRDANLKKTPHVNRRRRDSNPRYGCPYNGFQDRRLQPLGHSSNTICFIYLSSVCKTRVVMMTTDSHRQPRLAWNKTTPEIRNPPSQPNKQNPENRNHPFRLPNVRNVTYFGPPVILEFPPLLYQPMGEEVERG